MRKQKTLAIIAACVLATSCPYAVTAGEIEKQEVTTEVYAASEDVICSGDCSKTSGDDVEWKITKIDDSGKLKLIISGYGDMKEYGYDEKTLPEIIEDELYNLPEDVDFTYISDVEVCEGVQSIGFHAFECSDIEHVYLSDSVKVIGNGAFVKCDKLKSIRLPSSLDYIGGGAFEESGLISVTIPGTKEIEWDAFKDCKYLKKVIMEEGTTEISHYMFEGCTSLEEIVLPKKRLKSIGVYAFRDCSSLKEINIPKGVKTISGGAFVNCSSLKEISIPQGVTEIDNTHWEGCKRLKTIRLPHSIKKIKVYGSSFANDTPLSDIYFNGTKEEWDKIEKDGKIEKKITIHYLEAATPTPTATPKPTATPVPTTTPTPTATPIPTATATPVPTATPIPTATPVPTATPTPAAVKITGQVCGTGLSLKGKIGANVLLGFTDTKAVEAADPSVVINVDGKETVLKLSEQEHYTSGKKEIYEIQTYVPAKQINEKIDLKLIDKNGNTISLRYGKKNLSSFTFSVSEITDTYLSNYEQYGEKTIDLVTAIQNYCGYAQLMTGYKTETAKITDKLLYISAKDLKPYATVVDKGSKIAKYAGTGLALQSDTTMQIYFKLTDNADAYTFTLDGEAVTPEGCGNSLYCVKLKSIPAGKLSTASELMIRKGSETYTIKASALSWAESVLSNTKGQKQTTINMAKMLYRYSQKAEAYFAKK